jgi:hypothetical protein
MFRYKIFYKKSNDFIQFYEEEGIFSSKFNDDFDTAILINTFIFEVNTYINKIVWIHGYWFKENWIKTELSLPKYIYGKVCINEEISEYHAFRLGYADSWKMYYDKDKDLLKLGDDNANNKNLVYIKILSNLILGIDNNGNLQAMYIDKIISNPEIDNLE